MPKVTHFELLGPDGKKLQDFYANLFGWTIDANNPMNYGIVAPTDNGIGGGITQSQDGKPGSVIYIEVDRVDPYLEKAKAAGGKVIMERTVLPGMVTFAQFQDPAGNLVGLAETEVPPAQ
jgi:predicted enzyme related to lactoylglutathione lyase